MATALICLQTAVCVLGWMLYSSPVHAANVSGPQTICTSTVAKVKNLLMAFSIQELQGTSLWPGVCVDFCSLSQWGVSKSDSLGGAGRGGRRLSGQENARKTVRANLVKERRQHVKPSSTWAIMQSEILDCDDSVTRGSFCVLWRACPQLLKVVWQHGNKSL